MAVVRIVKLDVIYLCAADDGFLLFGFEGLPSFEIMNILLNDDVACNNRESALSNREGI